MCMLSMAIQLRNCWYVIGVNLFSFIEEVEKNPENVVVMKGGSIAQEVVGKESLKHEDDYRDPMTYLSKKL